MNSARKKILYLMWDLPWPLRSGKAIRSYGLLTVLSKLYDVELISISYEALTLEQKEAMAPLCVSFFHRQIVGQGISNWVRILKLMFFHCLPYHCALMKGIVNDNDGLEERIRSFSGPIFADHFWTFLLRSISLKDASRWIVDQVDECISMWLVSMSEQRWFFKGFCFINYLLSRVHYKKIYRKAGCVISVCEEDKFLTLSHVPCAHVEVILNGVDCSHYHPPREPRSEGPLVLLFTGTSVRRNLTALNRLVHRIFPRVRKFLPDVKLVVGGNFNHASQLNYSGEGIYFTGPVEDIRKTFGESDIFLSPFNEAHGSKLKVAEAMAMGLPIVATPQGVRGFPLRSGQSVVLATSDEEFVRVICRLASDPGQRHSIGKAARKIAEEKIDWAAQSNNIKAIVETVAGEA